MSVLALSGVNSNNNSEKWEELFSGPFVGRRYYYFKMRILLLRCICFDGAENVPFSSRNAEFFKRLMQNCLK